MRNFSVSFYSQYRHKLNSAVYDVIRLQADWHFSDSARFFSVSIGLFGFCGSLTFYPEGKP